MNKYVEYFISGPNFDFISLLIQIASVWVHVNTQTRTLLAVTQFNRERCVFGSLRTPLINYNFWIRFNYWYIVSSVLKLMFVQFHPPFLALLLNSICTWTWAAIATATASPPPPHSHLYIVNEAVAHAAHKYKYECMKLSFRWWACRASCMFDFYSVSTTYVLCIQMAFWRWLCVHLLHFLSFKDFMYSLQIQMRWME